LREFSAERRPSAAGRAAGGFFYWFFCGGWREAGQAVLPRLMARVQLGMEFCIKTIDRQADLQ